MLENDFLGLMTCVAFSLSMTLDCLTYVCFFLFELREKHIPEYTLNLLWEVESVFSQSYRKEELIVSVLLIAGCNH